MSVCIYSCVHVHVNVCVGREGRCEYMHTCVVYLLHVHKDVTPCQCQALFTVHIQLD